MNSKELSKVLTDTLNKATQRVEDKRYIVGGKMCKLVKEGNKWIKVEVKV